MGLFGSSVPLGEDLRQALINDSGSDRRTIAKGQAAIRGALRPGEKVTAIALDNFTGSPVLIVTDRRLLVMAHGMKSVQQSLGPDQIDQAAAAMPGSVQVINDNGDLHIRLGSYAPAQALVKAIHSMLARRRRSIPVLYPDYFLDLLAEVGTPATPTNVSRFVERTFAMVMSQANTFFQQLDDERAQTEFARRFDGGGPADRTLNSVDDMIDWLWKWNPGCHRALERSVQKWHDGLLMPQSFLRTNGADITPLSGWATKQ